MGDGTFDVFLSHKSVDDKVVLRIATKLREAGFSPGSTTGSAAAAVDFSTKLKKV
jgi:hypothetical protein